MTVKQPTFYIPHGGGPCFFMEWTLGPADEWDNLAAWLSSMPSLLENRPDAIVVVSAHWETSEFCVIGAPQPDLIYDYYGFPPHTYEIRYPAAGSPELAGQIVSMLNEAGISCDRDDKRGFDHGMFIPLKLIYPDADIPTVQLSLKSGLDPINHIEAGRALAPLREQNILIVGSGLSSHNLSVMMKPGESLTGSPEFNQWLGESCADSPEDRELALASWYNAPYAREVHPREEHLLPLMVAAGAAGDDPGQVAFHDRVMGADAIAIQFG